MKVRTIQNDNDLIIEGLLLEVHLKITTSDGTIYYLVDNCTGHQDSSRLLKQDTILYSSPSIDAERAHSFTYSMPPEYTWIHGDFTEEVYVGSSNKDFSYLLNKEL